MFGKKRTLWGFILAATGIPYFWNEPQALDKLVASAKSFFNSTITTRSNTGSDFTIPSAVHSSSWNNLFSGWHPPASAEGAPQTPMYELESVVRFDVSPRWVLEYWPRVTTVIAENQLEGLRSTLLTGTQFDDIAGSITYYFDTQHVVQRISIRGFTGDDRKLVAMAVGQFGMKAEPAFGGGLYCTKWNGRPVSALRISYAPVVTANSHNTRFDFVCEINRPGGKASLSEEFRQLIQQTTRRG